LCGFTALLGKGWGKKCPSGIFWKRERERERERTVKLPTQTKAFFW
jgi:hypothetical protein